jgi:hypothetical protein
MRVAESKQPFSAPQRQQPILTMTFHPAALMPPLELMTILSPIDAKLQAQFCDKNVTRHGCFFGVGRGRRHVFSWA